MTQSSRFVVGLDLGTTNCALSYAEPASAVDGTAEIRTFAVEQLVRSGEVESASLLPSFVFVPGAGEFDAAGLRLPWAKEVEFAVGAFAREHGATVPTRLISSAKSWLCHPQIDRRGPLLPWLAEETFPKISPVEATARILGHLRDSWNHAIAGRDKASRLENQDIVLTTPASFDAVARELTIEAARLVGLERITLFEEPQAAFYAWLHDAGDGWRRQVRPGDVALVVDVGGGTTDLTLIAVSERDGDLALERLAVGDHLLLGGDNMDLALAHAVAFELSGKNAKLDAVQMLGLVHACRGAKERLFEDAKAKSQPITVLGRGRKVVGGAIRTDLQRAQVESILVDGFFPKVKVDSKPTGAVALALQEMGLPYVADPAVTRHMASFLSRHADSIRKASGKRAAALPSAVLFNGGVFRAAPLQQRVLEVLNGWAADAGGDALLPLASGGLERAVAVGAAYYGLIRRSGRGVRIRGGVPRSYYIGVETPRPAIPGIPPPIKTLCVVQQGTEEGTEAEVAGREFGLVVGDPVQFRFFSSTQRRGDVVGALIDDWEESIQELAPLETRFDADRKGGEVAPVRLHTRVTEVGTLEIWFAERDGKRRWKLEFNVREPESSQ